MLNFETETRDSHLLRGFGLLEIGGRPWFSKGEPMIPHTILKEHVLKAIDEIDRDGVPVGRASRKFLLKYGDKTYPPKYVVARAAYYATGKELDPDAFSGGHESNSFLERLDFTIVHAATGCQIHGRAHVPQPVQIEPRAKSHDERCSECKNRIHEMFRTIYGQFGVVRNEHKFSLDQRLETYQGTRHHESLRRILAALMEHRDHCDFVRKGALHPSDVFVDPPGFLVELDESQHFTVPRAIALEHYPGDIELGFDRQEWISLSRKMARNDPDPRYRDEQRAWYDTIRDFAPLLSKTAKAPTVRIRLGGYAWCDLDPCRPEDVDTFKRLVRLPEPSTKREPCSTEVPNKPQAEQGNEALIHPRAKKGISFGKSARTPLTNSSTKTVTTYLREFITVDRKEHLLSIASAYHEIQMAYRDWVYQFDWKKPQSIYSSLRTMGVAEEKVLSVEIADGFDSVNMFSSRWNPITLPLIECRANEAVNGLKSEVLSFIHSCDDTYSRWIGWYLLFFIHPVIHELYFFDVHYGKDPSQRVADWIRGQTKDACARQGLEAARKHAFKKRIQGLKACGTKKYQHLHLFPQFSLEEVPDIGRDKVAEFLQQMRVGRFDPLSEEELHGAMMLAHTYGQMEFDKWFEYAPCAINEGPLYKPLSADSLPDCFLGIATYLSKETPTQEGVRSILSKYLDIEVDSKN
jgi:hypothetical protein